jgi:hypothetical protein
MYFDSDANVKVVFECFLNFDFFDFNIFIKQSLTPKNIFHNFFMSFFFKI